jgi:hypothetical protein
VQRHAALCIAPDVQCLPFDFGQLCWSSFLQAAAAAGTTDGVQSQ